jgi:hypothetical protein
MDMKVTDSVQPLLLETDPYQALTETLQLLLATRPTLALVMLVGEVPDGASTEAQRTLKASMDDVEQLLLACFRRSDKVTRCGDASCAAILMDAEVEGALRAIHRFQRMLGCWSPLAVALRVGVAAAPEQAGEGRALLTQALQPRFRILPTLGTEQETLPRMDELFPGKSALSLEAPKVSADQEKASKTTTYHLRQMLATATASALSSEPAGQRLLSGTGATPPVETLTKARARALGVPYIAPPQRIPSSVRNLLPAEVMRQLHCLPIGRDRRGLTVALADPTDRGVLQRLEQMTGLTIFPVMTDPDALEALAPPVRARRASQVASPQS